MPIRARYRTMICRCGCGEKFESRLNYRHRGKDGKATFPVYKRGHHPNCRKTQTSNKAAWNSGLTKADHPSIVRMGFQPKHRPYNGFAELNARLKNDPKLKRLWLRAKKGQVPWNKGITRSEYPNGFKSGEAHGNWLGGRNGVRDTSMFAAFRRSILKRDHWTCQMCGGHSHKGRGSRIILHVDHIEPICIAPERIMDPSNARTLCFECHKKTETYGPKVRLYVRKRREI